MPSLDSDKALAVELKVSPAHLCGKIVKQKLNYRRRSIVTLLHTNIRTSLLQVESDIERKEACVQCALLYTGM
jgi:hypothetical protein